MTSGRGGECLDNKSPPPLPPPPLAGDLKILGGEDSKVAQIQKLSTENGFFSKGTWPIFDIFRISMAWPFDFT
jgi:hypothetical protein